MNPILKLIEALADVIRLITASQTTVLRPEKASGKTAVGSDPGPQLTQSQRDVATAIRHQCRVFGVRPELALGHAWVESRLDQTAVNKADPSFGAMQILCKADSPHAPCRNRLPAIPDFQHATQSRLLQETRFNAQIGVQLIAANLRQFPTEDQAIIAYNNYSAALADDRTRNARKTGPGDYLDKVRRAERRFSSSR